MSIILRPEMDIESSQLITSCVAAAAASAIDTICGTDTQIKWVNDLFLNGKKICGILTEASVSFESGTLDFAVVGIGINVRSVVNVFPEELLKTATSIQDETEKLFDRSEIIAEVITSVEKYLNELPDRKFLEEYKKRSFIIGKRVIVTKAGEKREAIATGISENAGLEVIYDDGQKEVLNSGEARILPT